MRVVVGQPVLGGPPVVLAAPAPVGFDFEQVGKLGHQVVARHHPAGEEVLADPVGLVLDVESIGRGPMGEDVDEHPPVRFQPPFGAGQQGAPVGHVLEHLHRDDAVERARLRGEVVHVGCHDGEVRQALGLGASTDEIALALRVRDRGDARPRQGPRHPQRQRTPAAAQFQDRLAVGQLGMGGRLRQRRVLRGAQALMAGRIEAAGIFQVPPQDLLEEGRRKLVVLGVGRLGVLGDRPSGHLGGEDRGGVGRRPRQLPPRVGHQHLHRRAAHQVGDRRALEGVDGGGYEGHGRASGRAEDHPSGSDTHEAAPRMRRLHPSRGALRNSFSPEEPHDRDRPLA